MQCGAFKEFLHHRFTTDNSRKAVLILSEITRNQYYANFQLSTVAQAEVALGVTAWPLQDGGGLVTSKMEQIMLCEVSTGTFPKAPVIFSLC